MSGRDTLLAPKGAHVGRPGTRSPVGRRDALLTWLRSRSRRTLWLNGILALVLAAALVAAYFLVFGDDRTPTSTDRTATVMRGSLVSQVTGSGNSSSSHSTDVSFVTNGTVTSIKVKVGQTVKAGQVLATVDDTSAEQSLRTTRASLASAQAALSQKLNGYTAVQKSKDQLTIKSAQDSLAKAQTDQKNAQAQLQLDQAATQTSIDNARAQLGRDTTAQDQAVDKAQRQLDNDRTTQDNLVRQAQVSYDTARNALGSNVNCNDFSSTTSSSTTSSSTTSTSSTTTGTGYAANKSACDAVTSTQNSLTNAEQTRTTTLANDDAALSSSKQTRDSTLAKDREAVTSAQQTRDTTLTKDRQAIITAQQAVTSAQNSLGSAQLTAQGNAKPYTQADIQAARAQVASAQVDVEKARKTLADTALRAPQNGKVLDLNGTVGQNSSAASGSSSSSGGSGTGTSAGGTSSGTSGDTSAFVSIANLGDMVVETDIAEADAAGVKVGQVAKITFSATSTTVDGHVVEVSPMGTTSNNVVLYPVTVALDAPLASAKVGETASVTITTGEAQDVLHVDSSAVTTLGGRSTVTVQRGDAKSDVEVQTGLIGTAGTEITSGLSEGDVVVLPTSSGGASGGFPSLGGLGGGLGGAP